MDTEGGFGALEKKHDSSTDDGGELDKEVTASSISAQLHLHGQVQAFCAKDKGSRYRLQVRSASSL